MLNIKNATSSSQNSLLLTMGSENTCDTIESTASAMEMT